MTAEVRPEENAMTLVADFVPRRSRERGVKRVRGALTEYAERPSGHR